MKEIIVDLKEKKYSIYIEKGLLNVLGEEVKKVFSGNRVVIISDENVYSYYGEVVEKSLQEAGFDTASIVVEPGEKSKSVASLLNVYDRLLEEKITRDNLIIALGGGVVGDLAGFAASTFLRGIKYIQVPTSLLAQIDSSIGGKVGIDLPKGKNLIGSFYHPLAVFIDPNALKTLDKRYLYGGMAEIIKYGCIKDKSLFENLMSYKKEEDIFNNIEYIICTCCEIKKEAVEKDEKDTGERMLLNFGHTIGHAIEKYYNFDRYEHGEAVAIGMYIITQITENMGITKEGTAQRIKEALILYKLPYSININSMDKFIDAIKLDKKNLNDSLNIIVIDTIGESRVMKSDIKQIKDGMSAIKY